MAEREELLKRIENQRLALVSYQEKIYNYEERLEKTLKKSYPAPTFQETVRTIFKEIMHEEVLSGQS